MFTISSLLSAMEAKAPKSTFLDTIKYQMLGGIRKWGIFMESTLEILSAPDSVSSKSPFKPIEMSTYDASSLLFRKLESMKYHNIFTQEDH